MSEAMDAVNIDVRMMRDGTRWCSVATVRSPAFKGPIDLYADGDLRGLATMFRSRENLARASSSMRRGVRKEILKRTRGLVAETSRGMGPAIASHVARTLEACDAASDLVSRARAGDRQAQAQISKIFERARGGDANALRSARLLLSSAELVDEGRCTIRMKVAAPARAVRREPLMLPARTGHDLASVALRRGPIALDVEDEMPARHMSGSPLDVPTPFEVLEALPYPASRNSLH